MDNKKHVIITGGAKGIGASCVNIFARDGHNVTILDIDSAKGKELATAVGDQANFIHCDVSVARNVEKAFASAIAIFGEVDILVNNAAVQFYGTVTSTTEEEWDQAMNINLKSSFLCSKHAIRSMQKISKGVVIIISSVQAYMSQANVAAYTTIKTGLLGLTRSIAVDYAPNIRCVAICPGSVDTPMLQDSIAQTTNPEEVLQDCNNMHLTQRIGKPEEIGELVAFVASEKGSFMTGQGIRVDGGMGVTISSIKEAE